MRFIAVAILAVCLLHGTSARAQPQFPDFGKILNEAAGKVTSAASGAVNAVNQAAQNAVDMVSGAVKNVFDNAHALNLNELKQAIAKFNPEELIQTIQNAEARVQEGVQGALDNLSNAVHDVESMAGNAIASATANLNPEVKKVVDAAVAAGADVTECTTDTALALGESAVKDVVKCGTDKIDEAIELAQNIAGLVPAAQELGQKGTAGFKACNARSNLLTIGTCHASNIRPVAVDSLKLVQSALGYSAKATKLVATLRTSLETCAAKVVATKAVEAAVASKKVVSCVLNKHKKA